MGKVITMTTDFSLETTEPEEKLQYFSSAERKELSVYNPMPSAMSFKNKGKLKAF